MGRRFAWCVLFIACSSSDGRLLVDLRTDFISTREFTRAEVLLLVNDEVQSTLVHQATNSSYLDGVRIGEPKLKPGSVEVNVRLFDVTTLVAERNVLVDMTTADTAVVVGITRSCVGVTCEDAARSECLSGRCISMDCVTLDSCDESECSSASDCDSGSACEVPSCRDGACFLESSDDLCDSNEVCSAASGCRPAETTLSDGGTTDGAEPLDTGTPDANSPVEPCSVESFESGVLPMNMETGGDADWSIDSSRAHEGDAAARAGAVMSGQVSFLRASIDLAEDAQISFWVATSAMSGGAVLSFSLDGVQRDELRRSPSFVETSLIVPSGAHSMEWRFTNDDSAPGESTAFVDDIAILPVPPASSSFDDGLPAGWRTYGDERWRTSANGHTGVGLQAGPIVQGEETYLERVVHLESPGSVSFWYAVDSEEDFDFLEFHVDGPTIERWSGSVPWAEISTPLSAGVHTLIWRYASDGATPVGLDTAWIDDVVITNEASSFSCEM